MFTSYNLRPHKESPYLFLKENADCYSSRQINEHLKLIIENIQDKVPLFPKIEECAHYVFLGKEQEDIDMVSGLAMRQFSVQVPTVEMLRNGFLAEGVTYKEKLALSRAIEDSFDEHLDSVYSRINEYAYTLLRLYEISSVTIETLHVLLGKTQKSIALFRERIPYIPKRIDLAIAFDLILRRKSQERFIQSELVERTKKVKSWVVPP